MKLDEAQKFAVINQIASQMTSEDAKDPAMMQYKACRRFADIYMPLLNDRAPIMRMMDSVRIYAKVDSVEYEAGTTRYIVRYTALRKDAQQEHVRTERTDAAYGSLVCRMLRIGENGESNIVGKRVVVYKYSEHLETKNSHGGDTIRVTPYIELLP